MGRPSKRFERSAATAAEEATAAAAAASKTETALPWGIKEQHMQPSSLTALTDDKLARFVIGQQKKTKFEKDREEREAKKRKADAEAAQIYATFVASFENDDETLGKAFVRGGNTGVDTSDSQRPGELYRLQPSDAHASAARAVGTKKVSEMQRMLDEMKQNDALRQSRREQFGLAETSSSTIAPAKKKRREIDQFLDELKEREPTVPTAVEMGLGKGSFDHGDPTTTNLYVGNLAPTVTEESLEALFGKYGDVYSVKIMWPRTDEERARKRNCGFVSFFDRQDADDARVSLHDRELEGYAMVVGWGKAVRIDPNAPRRSSQRSVAPAATAASGSLLAAPTPEPAAVEVLAPAAAPQIVVVLPADAAVRERIDRLAQYVATDGQQFENAVRAREARLNSDGPFGFLFDPPTSPLATYYRWRVFAFAMGDSARLWREMPFQMTHDGAVWLPPPMPPAPASRKRQHSRSRSASRGRSRHASRSSSSRSRSNSSNYRRSRRSRSRSRRSRSRRSSSRSRSRRRSRSRSFSDSPRRRRSHSRSRGRRYSSSSSDSSRSRSRSRSRSSHTRAARLAPLTSRRHPSDTGSAATSASALAPARLLTGQQIARARDIERGREPNRLEPTEVDEFRALLAALTLERVSVQRVMGFALDHAEAAADIVDVLQRACAHPRASAGARVAFLYAASDILHNSSAGVKNASQFRTALQSSLPAMLAHLRRSHRALTGRMSANAMKDKVLRVLSAWENWSLFPPQFLVGLNATFLHRSTSRTGDGDHNVDDNVEKSGDTVSNGTSDAVDNERLRKACRQAGIESTGSAKQLRARLEWLREFTAPAPTKVAVADSVGSGVVPAARMPAARVRTEVDDDLDGEPIDDTSLQVVPNDNALDLDGEPMDDGDGEDLDGQPLDGDDSGDIDGAPMGNDGDDLDGENLDGAPLDDDDSEDLDGEPLDGDAREYSDDLDGEPM